MKNRAFSRVLVIVGLSTLILAAAGCSVAPGGPPGSIQLSVSEFDFGTIPNSGPVRHVFQVRNIGEGELLIESVSTSCGCTTAEINSHSLAPGATADLQVTYDPLAHAGATGEFMRQVFVRSNDPDTPEVVLTLWVTVEEP